MCLTGDAVRTVAEDIIQQAEQLLERDDIDTSEALDKLIHSIPISVAVWWMNRATREEKLRPGAWVMAARILEVFEPRVESLNDDDFETYVKACRAMAWTDILEDDE